VASLACQASRIAELQDGLTHQQAAISHRYSVAGLAFTAGSAIAGGVAGFIANSTIANVTSISGGGLETLVVMLELDVAPAGTLRLQQNILEEFWRAPETPTFFPQRVWRYLNTSVIPGGQTPRESIIASWRQDHLIPDEDFTPEPPPIILKRDSVKSDELDIMRQLIATLEARVGLMSRSMGRLVEELLERSEAASLNRLDARPQIRLSVLDPSTPGPDNSSRPTVARQATRVSQPPHEPPTGLASRPLRQTTVTGSLQAGISQPDAPAALDTAGRSAIDLEQRDGSMVLQAMNSWLDAWRARDVDLYLSFYSDSFLPRNVQDLAEWRQRRQATIASSGTIALSVRDTRMQFTGTDQALINFHQTYRANGIELRTNKRLVWRRENSGWRIISEDVVGERRGR
jgi:ketosteroid isomerase-like protein